MRDRLGKVTIHTDVLHTIVRMTTLAMPGVARFSVSFSSGGISKVFSPDEHKGVKIRVEEDRVWIDLYIVAYAEANVFELGHALQEGVRRAIENMVGMDVAEVNVYVEDVEFAP